MRSLLRITACSRAAWPLLAVALATGALAANKSGTRPNVINVPSGPGSVGGLGESFEVALNSGTVKETLTIAVPPGTAGHAPRLSLQYDSGAGNGLAGIGWTLPLTTIQRQTEKGVPRYDASDRFLFSGTELVQLADGTYRLRHEGGFIRARRTTGGWEVDYPDGSVRRFGTDPTSRVEDGGRVFAWYLEDEIDPFGNRVSYFYELHGRQPFLVEVAYNRRSGAADNRILFDYEDRADLLHDYRSGFDVVMARRLTGIRVYAQAEQVRSYTLTYAASASGLSQLAGVRLTGSDGTTSLPTMEFSYSAFTPALQPVQRVAGAPAALPGSGSPDAELVDFDGDGFPDLLVAQTADHLWYRNLGGKSFAARVEVPSSPSVALGAAGVELADVNADGLVDLVAKSGTTGSGFRFFPNLGTGTWAESVVFGNNPSFAVEDGATRWADLDNDKLVDAFRLTSSSAVWWRNQGDGVWSTGSSLDLPPGESALDLSDSRVKLQDVNGDRVVDLAFVRSGSVLVWPGMGGGRFDAPHSLLGAPEVGSGVETRLMLADLDGDGLADLLMVGANHVEYWLQRGDRSFSAGRRIENTPYAHPSLTDVRMGDLNGNGSADLVWFTPTAAVADRVQYLDVLGGVRPNLLTGLVDGAGKVRTVTYTSTAEQYQRALDAGEPWITRLPMSIQVVGASSLSDSLGGEYVTEYVYADGYYDGADREFRGFGRVTRRELGDEGDPTEVNVHQFDLGLTSDALKGRELSVELRDGSGVLSIRKVTQYEVRTYATGVDGVASEGALAMQLDAYLQEGGAVGAHLRQTYAYDAFGNVTESRNYGRVVDGDPLAGDDETYSFRSYAYDTEAWVLGRATEDRLTNAKGETLSHTRHYFDGEAFVGLPLGQLTKGIKVRTEVWAGGERWIQAERNQVDAFGNIVATLTPRGFRREIEYDPETHSAPVAEHIFVGDGRVLSYRATYAKDRGLLVSFSDANGATTDFQYDPLQRLTAVIKPLDSPTHPTLRYAYQVGNPLSVITTEERPFSGEDEVYRSYSYRDGLGRELWRAQWAENDLWAISGRKEYSRRGAVVTEWDSYFAAAPDEAPPASVPVTRYQYDAQGRLSRTTFPDGTYSERRHGALWSESWDPEDLTPGSPHEGTPIRHELDGQGRTIATIERLGTSSLITQFAYDAASRLVSVRNAAGAVATYEYDPAGELLALVHPDAGRRTYQLDDDGNLLVMRDAAGNEVIRTYDGGGRVLTESLVPPGGTPRVIRYHYDDASPRLGDGNSLGKLSWVEDLAGEEHFSYDVRGRLRVTLRKVGDREYRTEQAFDALDHVVALTYPDGTTLPYVFNRRGLLESVPTVVTRLEYNAQGLAVRREFANGVIATAEYDQHDRVAHLRALDSEGREIQSLDYGYDRAGTLKSVADGLHPTGPLSGAWAFAYDDLYRLKDAEGPGGRFSHDYDPVGNLLQKSDVGTFSYDSAAKPNAVRTVGGREVAYDANGAVIEAFGRTFSYDARGQLQRVEGDGASTELTYDYEGLRAVKVVRKGSETHRTVYIDKFSEERDDKLVKYVFSGDTRLARIGGGTPTVVEVATAGVRFTGGALAALGLLLLPLGAAAALIRPLRRQRLAMRLTALALVSSLAGCNCGAPTGPPDGTIFYVADHLGSAEVLTDVHGKVVAEGSFDPWGVPIVGTTDPYGFGGQEWDAEAGIYNAGARSYDPRLGRFLSVDPVALRDPQRSIDDPQALNPYSYARNTPTSLRDRDGQFAHILVGALAGAVVNTGIYLVKGAINGESYSMRGALASAASGAVSGAVVAATGGAGLLVSGALSSAAGGVVERGINTGSVSEALNPKAVLVDAAVGAAGSGLAKVASSVGKKVVGAVKGRMGGASGDAIEAAAKRPSAGRPGCGCFVAGTLVLLASGEMMPIEQIAIGDVVAAPVSLHEAAVVHGYPVVATPGRVTEEVIELVVEDSSGHRESLTTTPEHPFAQWTKHGSRWLRADQLRVGDSVHAGSNLTWIVQADLVQRPTEVFNLEVAEAHAYYVGTSSVLVHNVSCSIPNRPGTSKELAKNLHAEGRMGGTVGDATNAAAHHMVAARAKAAKAARTILNKVGLPIDDSLNGVFLPKNTKFANGTAMTHSTLHTKRYYEEVTNRLKDAYRSTDGDKRGAVLKALEGIRTELLQGTFPR